MSALAFPFEGNLVRTIVDEHGDPWFVVSDVCRALGHTNPTMAIASLDDDEKGLSFTETPGGRQELRTVSESGLYRLVLRSNKPEAKRFRRWVTRTVLPHIRKTGGYGAAKLDVRDPRQMAAVALQLAEYNRELQVSLEAAAPKVEFYDRFADADGRYGLQNAGRALGQPPRKFVESLKRDGYLFSEGGTLVPYAEHRESGLFEVRVVVIDDVARQRTYLTPKGLQYFAARLSSLPLPFSRGAAS